MRDIRRCVGFSVVALLIGGLAACDSTMTSHTAKREVYTKDDPSRGIICTEDAPTGSFLRTKKCTTPEQRAAQAQEAEHQMVVVPAPR